MKKIIFCTFMALNLLACDDGSLPPPVDNGVCSENGITYQQSQPLPELCRNNQIVNRTCSFGQIVEQETADFCGIKYINPGYPSFLTNKEEIETLVNNYLTSSVGVVFDNKKYNALINNGVNKVASTEFLSNGESLKSGYIALTYSILAKQQMVQNIHNIYVEVGPVMDVNKTLNVLLSAKEDGSVLKIESINLGGLAVNDMDKKSIINESPSCKLLNDVFAPPAKTYAQGADDCLDNL